MTHKIDFSLASSEMIEDALSQSIEDMRLRRNITQKSLAEEAGVSRSTITRLAQDGKGISLNSFIRILKALQIADNLKVLLPDPYISPLEELKRESQPERQRARTKIKDQKKWTWDDEGDSS
ncbi:helix-turn-helix domain-containing protein [Maritalea porphyrae]|uniref:helix-turn-helix domain-containing protein n=1 Tax=Maritalea porphyrae TaxID=880732 RepID=UPI0022AFB06A|nr:helix-turn-helix transcriptional regulator [Maritalea porphyrae]MCZ4273365.1 helix-turn-helix transcriptional regulator [Maritalea porphyrae]